MKILCVYVCTSGMAGSRYPPVAPSLVRLTQSPCFRYTPLSWPAKNVLSHACTSIRGLDACASWMRYPSGSNPRDPLMSTARGSTEDRLKYASPLLRTWTMSAFRFPRCASAISFSTWARDLIPSLKASTHIARYSDGPYTIGASGGVGDAEGSISAEGVEGVEGEDTTAARSPGPQALRTINRNRARPKFRLKRSRTIRDCARPSQSVRGGRAAATRSRRP